MLSKTHKLTEQLIAESAPLFKQTPDYETILQASCLWFARIIQACPYRGEEFKVLDGAVETISHALEEFLKIEEQAAIAKAAERDKLVSKISNGIEGFGSLTTINGSEPGPALIGEPVVIGQQGPIEGVGFKVYPDTKVKDVKIPSQEDKNDVASGIENSNRPEGQNNQEG